MGMNHKDYDGSAPVVSNASCSKNCLAPLAKVINDKSGVVEEKAKLAWWSWLRPEHRFVVNGRSQDRGQGIDGKLTGIAFRVLTSDVSAAVKAASEGELAGILGYTEDQVVSNDILHDKHSSTFDADACSNIDDNS
ncbi:putative glyceraldehyde/Erythrose phosphate dehydrogenase family [Plasmopara halstedii]